MADLCERCLTLFFT